MYRQLLICISHLIAHHQAANTTPTLQLLCRSLIKKGTKQLSTCSFASLAKLVQDIVPCHELIPEGLIDAAVTAATQKVEEGHGTSKVSEVGPFGKGVLGVCFWGGFGVFWGVAQEANLNLGCS